jgi:hypothetical protein
MTLTINYDDDIFAIISSMNKLLLKHNIQLVEDEKLNSKSAETCDGKMHWRLVRWNRKLDDK